MSIMENIDFKPEVTSVLDNHTGKHSGLCNMQKEKTLLIERLNEYISKVDSEWINRIKGASREDVELLKKYTGVKENNLELPDSFVEFVESAGEGDGGLISDILNGEFSIKELVETNKEIYELWPETMNPSEFEFLYDELGMPYIINLGSNNVIEYEDTCHISSSFENLLFQCAICKYEDKFYKNKIRFGASIKSFEDASNKRNGDTLVSIMKELIEEYDLEGTWFNDEYFFYAHNTEFSIILMKRVAIAGQLMGNNISQMEKLLERLLPSIGAKIQ